MITEVKNVEFEIIETPDTFAESRDDIEHFWHEHCLKNPDAYSEKILNLFDMEEISDCIKLRIGWINYYEAFYSKMIGNITTRNLFSGAYMLTSDGYYSLAVDMNSEINLIGGVASKDDFEDGKYIPELCLTREFREETGMDITSDQFTYALKYLKITSESVNYFPVGLIYEVKTNFSRKEIEEQFLNNSRDNELKKLLFVKLEDSETFAVNTRRKYIVELFDQIRNNSES